MKPVPRITILGFTLIEVLVVIAIIGILVSVAVVTLGGSSTQSRDAQRQADLRNLQQAIETYRSREGRYPAQCDATGVGSGGWSGQLGTIYACDDGTNNYIVGLAPEYIPRLPTDPKLNGTNSGYVYRTNADGSVYKIMAMNTVEADQQLRSGTVAAYAHPFTSCDMRTGVSASGDATSLPGYSPCYQIRLPNDSGWEAGTPPSRCSFSDPRYQTSYALWGGATSTASGGVPLDDDFNLSAAERRGIRFITDVVCK